MSGIVRRVRRQRHQLRRAAVARELLDHHIYHHMFGQAPNGWQRQKNQ